MINDIPAAFIAHEFSRSPREQFCTGSRIRTPKYIYALKYTLCKCILESGAASPTGYSMEESPLWSVSTGGAWSVTLLGDSVGVSRRRRRLNSVEEHRLSRRGIVGRNVDGAKASFRLCRLKRRTPDCDAARPA